MGQLKGRSVGTFNGWGIYGLHGWMRQLKGMYRWVGLLWKNELLFSGDTLKLLHQNIVGLKSSVVDVTVANKETCFWP